ncbi:anhydro-N-acetylmuramic acid kinase [Thalassotalea aquiviva]|uniref:anhydro-N-acetylmuramic acid kinase n=1 Tax=Thalassotalea aquiviva TaxID=3242415 RepID=UPI00352BA14E
MTTTSEPQYGFYIGIMSGTSVDGIDVALIEQTSLGCRFICGKEYPFAKSLRNDVLSLCEKQHTSLHALGNLTERLSLAYANAVNLFLLEQQLKASNIIALGCHGQTVFHNPNDQFPFSMQLVNPSILVARTGITTVHDFRSMDLALGGQGAPLVPLFHQSLLAAQDKDKSLVFVNIGGIANVSIVNPTPLQGYDTGPGNVLLDAWIQKNLAKAYDNLGEYARSGRVNEKLLNILLSEPYFRAPAPKSTGRELFNLAWLEGRLALFDQAISAENVMATLVELTVRPIVSALSNLPAGKLLVCGGGAKNISILKSLQQHLYEWSVNTSEQEGLSSDYMEAMAFAWLAYRCINGLAGNSIAVTGASKEAVCGSITQARIPISLLSEKSL